MNAAEVDAFRKMYAQLEALHQEAGSLAKKDPGKSLSALKVNLTNAILSNARGVLASSAPNLDFMSFDLDDLPTASDVSFVAAQFLECAEKVRCENIAKKYGRTWYWKVQDEFSDIVTSPQRGTR
jgi:hypothetical protein